MQKRCLEVFRAFLCVYLELAVIIQRCHFPVSRCAGCKLASNEISRGYCEFVV
jgi:hypothetical protein